MSQFTLAVIQPLVQHKQATGRYLTVTFRCPVSSQSVQARWQAPVDNSVSSKVTQQAKRTAWYEMRRQVNSMLYSVLGRGSMARMASQAVNTAMSASTRTSGAQQLSEADIEEGLVEAFRTVSGQFAWVEDQWVHASAAGDLLSAFEKQLHQYPIESRYDRLLTARMLVEIAGAHGGISDDEQIYLSDAIDPDLGSLESLVDRPPLTAAELGESTAGGTRQSMLAVAWSLALCDQQFDAAEEQRLHELAAGLGLSEAERDQVRKLAQGYLMDQALERAFSWGEHDRSARDQLYKIGAAIGMSRGEVELAEARFQKRQG